MGETLLNIFKIMGWCITYWYMIIDCYYI